MKRKGRSTTVVQFRVSNAMLKIARERWEAKQQSVNLYAKAIFIEHIRQGVKP